MPTGWPGDAPVGTPRSKSPAAGPRARHPAGDPAARGRRLECPRLRGDRSRQEKGPPGLACRKEPLSLEHADVGPLSGCKIVVQLWLMIDEGRPHPNLTLQATFASIAALASTTKSSSEGSDGRRLRPSNSAPCSIVSDIWWMSPFTRAEDCKDTIIPQTMPETLPRTMTC